MKEGRKPEPTASVIDTQSIKTSTNVPVTSQGTDAAKKIVGRKRGILTDTIGLILVVTVAATSLSENAMGIRLLDQAKETYPTISKSWVDTGFKNAVEHGAHLGIDVEVVNRNPGVRGFHVVKRRWVVERSFGWIMMHRRLARDYETLTPARSHDPRRVDRQPRQAHNGRDHTNLARNLLGISGNSPRSNALSEFTDTARRRHTAGSPSDVLRCRKSVSAGARTSRFQVFTALAGRDAPGGGRCSLLQSSSAYRAAEKSLGERRDNDGPR